MFYTAPPTQRCAATGWVSGAGGAGGAGGADGADGAAINLELRPFQLVTLRFHRQD